MPANIWDAIGQIGSGIATSFGGRSEPAYQAAVSSTSTLAQKQGSNMTTYLIMGGLGLIVVMFMMKK